MIVEPDIEGRSNQITVLISCPGDVHEHKLRAAGVVREIDAYTRKLGIVAREWTYEIDGRPGVGTDAQDVLKDQIPGDYDIYVGIMSERLGTPTGRAASGTVEEFLDAEKRRETTGRPEIFFYFHQDAEDPQDEQSRKVRQFRDAYPGFFREFTDVDHFASLLKHDVLLYLFQVQLGGAPRPSTISIPQQITDFLTAEVSEAEAHRSGNDVRRKVNRLDHAFGLADKLSITEQETLLCAVAVLARTAFGDLSGCQRLLETGAADFGWMPDVVQSTRLVVEEALGSGAGNDAALVTGVRVRVIAALVHLATFLDRDRTSLSGSSTQILSTDADVDTWIRYITREIRARPGGYVQFSLELPSQDWVGPVKRCTSFAVENLWNRYRGSLLEADLRITVEPSEVLLATNRSIWPDEALERIREEAARLPFSLPQLSHLGDPSSPCDLQHLLPIPGASTDRDIEISTTETGPCTVRLFSEPAEGKAFAVRNFSPNEVVKITVGELEPGESYRWELSARRPTGAHKLVRAGVFSLLAAEARDLAEQAAHLPSATRTALLHRLRLYNCILEEFWRSAASVTDEERLAVLEILVSALEFYQANYPELTQVEVYRTAAEWVQETFK